MNDCLENTGGKLQCRFCKTDEGVYYTGAENGRTKIFFYACRRCADTVNRHGIKICGACGKIELRENGDYEIEYLDCGLGCKHAG